MPTLQVDSFSFHFDATVAAQKYDRWKHYLQVWNAGAGGKKAVDVVAVEGAPPQCTVWLIEAKDFRLTSTPPKSSNIAGLPQYVVDKVADTLAGLTHASAHAADPAEKQHATNALACVNRRIVLHLEPHVGAHTALFPVGFAASVLQKLRQLAKAIDPNALVLNIANTPMAGVPWTVS
jgi:hypothetical protein